LSLEPDTKGRTIQLFLADGVPNGLIVATIHGWTGQVLVATQSTFARLLARPEVDRTGVYILFGPDPEDERGHRAYIGEADCVRERIDQSAGDRGFWETAVVITTSDEALTKGHVRYLEARLLDIAKISARVKLDNGQAPSADRRRLPEADRANMEAFLANLKIILPVVGLELLKPQPRLTSPTKADASGDQTEARFEIRHRSGVKAFAVEDELIGFMVQEGSEAIKDAGHQGTNSYGDLKKLMIEEGDLVPDPSGKMYRFARPKLFNSPSAASAVILDRNSNGRREWKVVGSKLTYHEWQEEKANRGSA
jgi:hypothetical protein